MGVPAADGAEHKPRTLAVTGGHIAHPILGLVADGFLATGALTPVIGVDFWGVGLRGVASRIVHEPLE